MAERRMFAKTIIDSDAFLDMPVSARLLYYDLGMRADDDGFVNGPKKIMRTTGSTEDDLKVLIAKKFIIPFENGIVVIKHWRINNYLRSDRYRGTTYIDEKSSLQIDENGAYTTDHYSDGIPCGIPLVDVGKDRIGKDTTPKANRFCPPILDEVKAYCDERMNGIDPQYFIDFYQANGWLQGKGKPIKDWKACVRTWEQKNAQPSEQLKPAKGKPYRFEERDGETVVVEINDG